MPDCLSTPNLDNEAEGARTLNLRINSPHAESDKYRNSKELHRNDNEAYKPAYKNQTILNEKETQNLLEDLTGSVKIWSELPKYIKAAIRTLNKSYFPNKK